MVAAFYVYGVHMPGEPFFNVPCVTQNVRYRRWLFLYSKEDTWLCRNKIQCSPNRLASATKLCSSKPSRTPTRRASLSFHLHNAKTIFQTGTIRASAKSIVHNRECSGYIHKRQQMFRCRKKLRSSITRLSTKPACAKPAAQFQAWQTRERAKLTVLEQNLASYCYVLSETSRMPLPWAFNARHKKNETKPTSPFEG